MNLAEYETMYAREDGYWWYVARRAVIGSIIADLALELERPLILDVGCGTGINFSVLSAFGETVGADGSAEALAFCKRRGIPRLVRSDGESLPFRSSSCDLVTAFDVLEHVANDLPALKEWRRVTKPAGLVVLTVPAYRFLWSDHDEALGHRRRYSAGELREKLGRAGFVVERLTYFNMLLFLPILVTRVLQNLKKRSAPPRSSHLEVPAWLNALLIRVFGAERRLLRWTDLPFGVSLVCVARKRRA